MLRTIKWELMKWYYRLRWIVLFTLGVLGIFLILTIFGTFNKDNIFNDYILKGTSLLIFAITLFFCVLLPSVNMIIDYILPNKYMEWTVQRRHQTIITVKLIVNAIICYIGVGFEVSMNLVLKIIPNGQIYSSSGSRGASIFIYLIFGVLVPLIVLYFYMLTYSIKAQIKHRILTMIILMAATFGAIYLIGRLTLINKIFGDGISGLIGIILICSLSKVMEKYEPR